MKKIINYLLVLPLLLGVSSCSSKTSEESSSEEVAKEAIPNELKLTVYYPTAISCKDKDSWYSWSSPLDVENCYSLDEATLEFDNSSAYHNLYVSLTFETYDEPTPTFISKSAEYSGTIEILDEDENVLIEKSLLGFDIEKLAKSKPGSKTTIKPLLSNGKDVDEEAEKVMKSAKYARIVDFGIANHKVD